MYHAWVDVGGTFTDCYVSRTAEKLKRCKLLSTGLVPISCARVVTDRSMAAPELTADVAGFWVGADLRAMDEAGRKVARRRVVGFADGVIECDQEIASCVQARLRFEIDASLESPVLAVRRLLGCSLSQALPPLQVRLGTTRGTNALLTRRGAQTALAITSPFEGLLLIGDQTRPNLFELGIRKLPQLAHTVVGIHERLDAQGQVLQRLDIEQTRQQLLNARQAGCTSLAICLMHSYTNSQHELQLEQLAREVGFEYVSRSSQIAPLIELVARAQTTVVDAYLSPIIRSYLARLVDQFGGAQVQLQVMTSAGGLTDWQSYSGKDSILSGPAGGVVALQGMKASLGDRTLNIEQLIGLDMGGTSTDVCRIGSDHQLQYESLKAGVRILTPTLPIETVASGGGSICWFDGVALRVGPQSAGASPGPACYGRGGPLTITDLNVYLERLPKEQFPFPPDESAITKRLDELLFAMRGVLPIESREQLAEGLRRLANEQMSAAVRTVSTAQGMDPRGATLVGFGGAAGQHICEIAELLGMSKVIDSAEAGLLSALGMGLAQVRRDAALPVYQLLDRCDWSECARLAEEQIQRLRLQLVGLGIASEKIESRIWCELRYRGTDATLTVAWSDKAQVAEAFHAEHEQRFGYARRTREIEVVALRVEALGQSAYPLPSETKINDRTVLAEALYSPAHPSDSKKIVRATIQPGQHILGPAVVMNEGSTLVIDKGWDAVALSGGTLLLERIDDSADKTSQANTFAFDPVVRDCLAQRLSAIATQMGVVLQQTAISVNVKQRRDYSCAVFDAAGRLLANAPHVPVHLGAMGQTVRGIMEAFPSIRPGDCFITNDPYRGGSHLPDVTVVTPVFGEDASPMMFVANRAHHADIGGVTPGSMSVVATRLGEEGVVIAPRYLVASGEDRTDDLQALLANAKYPPRAIAENLADVAAQQAANARGVSLLVDLADSMGWRQLATYSEYLLSAAAERVAQFLRRLPQQPRSFVDYLDDGTAIAVQISFPQPGRVVIDFEGTGPVSPTNFNANPSIVTAAVMYVLRCMIADELPLNEGVLRCVELKVPRGVLNPSPSENCDESPAVAAGNVETSQRVVDALLGAFGIAAASQGTMNNVLFGNQRFGFYETICGGAGAIEGLDGASGVHTHMTNTRLTDPEILESRYPVRLLQFGLRPNSGGAGRWRGGDGIVREFQFLEAVELSLLTSRRGPYLPYGMAGGFAGSAGENTLLKNSGERLKLDNCCHLELAANDRLQIETPGGGGFG
ncbi:MAG: hydantoinase B/oxoprolinase family protein [Pirellulaceae bacterium]|nr:hydantoinase B/oxoprolinase family protein [Pirellulaceae bacterium]